MILLSCWLSPQPLFRWNNALLHVRAMNSFPLLAPVPYGSQLSHHQWRSFGTWR
jgi:hypothetical protein